MEEPMQVHLLSIEGNELKRLMKSLSGLLSYIIEKRQKQLTKSQHIAP